MKRKIAQTAGTLLLATLLGTACSGEKSLSGIILDGSMNTVTLVTGQNDTITFSTVNADRSQANGLLIGDSITVYYTGKLIAGESGSATEATRVVVSHIPRPSELLIGAWLEPVNGMPGEVQGVRLELDGKAESINMATLLYETWRTENDGTLILGGQSVGNGMTIAFEDTMQIEKLTTDSLILAGNGAYRVRYARQQ